MAGELVKLKVGDIIVGSALPWPVYDSNGTFLVKQGFTIKSTEQVQRLITRGAYADQSDLTGEKSQSSNQERAQKPKDISPFKLLDNVTSQLALTLAGSNSSETDFTEEVVNLVKDVQRACDRDAHAAIASLFVLEGNSYPIKHSVDVAVLSEIMAKSRGIEREKRKSIVAAALTMNIAMIELQEALYRQQTPLTEEQKKAIHEHPKKGTIMLRQANVEDKLWLKCVLTHHETITGNGYPNKLVGSQFPDETQLIALADQYCARLSPRAYRDPLLHKAILRDILLDKGKTVEPEVAALFIKELGFFPPGLIVQLVSTEIGVVTKRGDKPDAPFVHVCMKPQIGNYAQPVVRNTAMDGYKIRRIVLSDDPDVTFERRTVWKFNED
ncbi:MAG: HD domain-containing protein [Methylophaga sp.]|nr:HD domain-containing protein [Methylophaga sp.]